MYLQEPEASFRQVALDHIDAGYLQFRSNVDLSGRTDLGKAAREAIRQLRKQSPRFIIVDQRFNIGGDLNTTRDLMTTIPEVVARQDGQVFVITSGRTFSAGIASVAYLKQAGGDRVTIIGRPVGDELEFWAEGKPLHLPYANVQVGRAFERHNYITGCQESDCHASIRRHPIRVGSLDPDIQPQSSYADFAAGEDALLNAVFGLIGHLQAAQSQPGSTTNLPDLSPGTSGSMLANFSGIGVFE